MHKSNISMNLFAFFMAFKSGKSSGIICYFPCQLGHVQVPLSFSGVYTDFCFLFFSMLGVQVSQLSFLPTKNSDEYESM